MSSNKPRGRSRLNRFIGLPNGLTADSALARAKGNIEAHRGAALRGLDAAIAEIGDLSGEADGPPQAFRARIQVLAGEIGAVAGLYDLAALGLAAQSLSELLAACRERQTWEAQGVAVHVSALRLLRRPDHTGGAAEAEVLKGLARIVERQAAAR